MNILIATNTKNIVAHNDMRCYLEEVHGHIVRTGLLQFLRNPSTAHERLKENMEWMDYFLLLMPSDKIADEECCAAFNSGKGIILFNPGINKDTPNPYPEQVKVICELSELLEHIS